MTIKIPVTLYDLRQARARFRELTGQSYSDQGLRERMKKEGLTIYRIGNSDVIVEHDLLQLSLIPPPKRGPARND